jgi:hypothetical protein
MRNLMVVVMIMVLGVLQLASISSASAEPDPASDRVSLTLPEIGPEQIQGVSLTVAIGNPNERMGSVRVSGLVVDFSEAGLGGPDTTPPTVAIEVPSN